MINRALFTSQTVDWATPQAVYEALDAEFHFNLDPCPLGGIHSKDGLNTSWVGKRVYCNPPYGPTVHAWLEKASEAEIAVYLLPARTDTRWFHDLALKASEIRFIKGRLKFGDSKNSAPFPSMILIFKALTQKG
jgi:hypothetical protein